MSPTQSCLYEGAIRHRRYEGAAREFRHRLALAYIDLDELPRLAGGRLVRRGPGLLRFRRRDYLGDPTVPLREAVAEEVQRQGGEFPRGPIRVLTGLRSFGHCFNPVSFYLCFDAGGTRLEHVLAEVTNTPWGERHAYLITATTPGTAPVTGQSTKRLHVSPFMGMAQSYTWRVGAPGRRLEIHIENRGAEHLLFDATLALRRRELTRSSLAGITIRYPFATLRVLALIYGHAIALGLRGVPIHPHPRADLA